MNLIAANSDIYIDGILWEQKITIVHTMNETATEPCQLT